MPVRSLLEMCQRKGKRNSQNLEHLGDYRLTYRIARPILRKIKSPEQLRRIEEASPQILGETGELWLNFIKRDIPDWQNRKHEPANPESWWKVYRKLKNDVDAEEAARIEGLEASLLKNNTKVLAEVRPTSAFTFRPTLKQKWAEEYFTGKKLAPTSKRKLGVLAQIKKDVKSARTSLQRQQQPPRNFSTQVRLPPPQFVEDIKKRKELAARRIPKKSTSPPASGLDAGAVSTGTPRKSPPKSTFNSPSRPSIFASSFNSLASSQRARPVQNVQGSPSQKSLTPGGVQLQSPRRSVPQAAHPATPARSNSVLISTQTHPVASISSLASSPSPTRQQRNVSDEELKEKIRLADEKHSPPRSNPSSRPSSSSGSLGGESPKLVPIVRKRKNEPDIFLPAPKKRFIHPSSVKLNRR